MDLVQANSTGAECHFLVLTTLGTGTLKKKKINQSGPTD